MNTRTWLVLCIAIALAVLAAPLPSQADLPTLFRKKTVPSAKKPPTMNGLARLVTHLEDDLRKYGSITVKAPDVWGESTLMSMVQEYERYMRVDAEDFEATMQGYIARADQASLQAEFSMGLAASNAAEANNTTVVEAPPTSFAPVPGTPFEMLPKDFDKFKLSLEPTEQTREHSVFLKVNQALRRTNLGDDNSRQPGYTSYVLRFPVSVIPGRDTFQGCAAVVNLRARIVLGENHLHDTFPRLAASDAAAKVAQWVLVNWDKPVMKCQELKPADAAKDWAPSARGVAEPTLAVTDKAVLALYGEDNLNVLRGLARFHFDTRPKADDLERFLFGYLMQVHLNLERQGAYSLFAEQILETGRDFAQGCLQQVEGLRRTVRDEIARHYALEGDPCPGGACASPCQANETAAGGWILLAQSAILDLDIKRLLRAQDGSYALPPDANSQEVRFFEPFGEPYLEASAVWNQLIEASFPVHLFTLDPVVEQQNYYDAFSRRRELQLAMAMAVAKGEMRARAAVRFTRQLSLDMLAIGLNRTAVAYAADNDTFGWYFYPRLQSPPEESSNIAAFARLLWSTGPTRKYDLRHRQLEPGIRECEAVIVMPAFVPNLKIDITTNWERLVKPGAIKVDYVKMIDEAAMIQQAVGYSSGVTDQECYRPEDYDILCSRIDQLGKMLPMQQQVVRLPFPYVLGGTELFDSGNHHLPPRLIEYYGLEWLPMAKAESKGASDPKPAPGQGGAGGLAGGGGGGGGEGGGGSMVNVTTNVGTTPATASAAKGGDSGVYFFLSGRHFHPTQTHVIAGGVKSDSLDATPVGDVIPKVADVVVISRELLRVKLTGINPQLTKCCISVYVATPAGVSNALAIPLEGTCPEACMPRSPADGGCLSSCCSGSYKLDGTLKGGEQKGCATKIDFTTTDPNLAKLLTNKDPKAKPKELVASVYVPLEGGSICIPLDGSAKVSLKQPVTPNKYQLAIDGYSLAEKLSGRGFAKIELKDFMIGYPDKVGLRCLTGVLAVTSLQPGIVATPSPSHEVIYTPFQSECPLLPAAPATSRGLTDENPLRDVPAIVPSDAPDDAPFSAPDDLPVLDDNAPPAPTGARRPGTAPLHGGAPAVQPASSVQPMPLDKAALLRPVRLPPIRDTSVRQAAAWEQ